VISKSLISFSKEYRKKFIMGIFTRFIISLSLRRDFCCEDVDMCIHSMWSWVMFLFVVMFSLLFSFFFSKLADGAQ